jgi:hypothetical protein
MDGAYKAQISKARCEFELLDLLPQHLEPCNYSGVRGSADVLMQAAIYFVSSNHFISG